MPDTSGDASPGPLAGTPRAGLPTRALPAPVSRVAGSMFTGRAPAAAQPRQEPGRTARHRQNDGHGIPPTAPSTPYPPPVNSPRLSRRSSHCDHHPRLAHRGDRTPQRLRRVPCHRPGHQCHIRVPGEATSRATHRSASHAGLKADAISISQPLQDPASTQPTCTGPANSRADGRTSPPGAGAPARSPVRSRGSCAAGP